MPKLSRSTSCTLRLLAASLLALANPALAQQPAEPAVRPARPPLLLMGTVPVYWGEAADFADLLNGSGQPHWARAMLERGFALVPLDTLEAGQLAQGGGRLLLAQPRALSPAENVALDAWVRAGGRVLLFADPLMTGESRFAIGDRRRPQDVALLSPLLGHWGLELQFDDEQGFGLKPGDAGVAQVPVNLPGQLVLAASATGECQVLGDGLAARCVLGEGEALVVADAALLDLEGPWPGAERGLAALLDSAFGVSVRAVGEIGDDVPRAARNGANPPFPGSGHNPHGHADPP